MKLGFVALFAASLLVACSGDSGVAGVISETDSGNTVAGALSSGEFTVAGARVSLVPADYVQLGGGDAFTAEADSLGAFAFDSVPAGAYALWAEGSEGGLGRELLSVSGAASVVAELLAGTTVEVLASAFGAASGDTICVAGTPVCAAVGEDGFAGLELAAGEYSAVVVSVAGELDTLEVGWTLPAGASLLATTSFARPAMARLSATLPDSLLGDFVLDSLAFPVWLEASLSEPALVSANGVFVPLVLGELSGDSALYWAVAPEVPLEASALEFFVVDSAGEVGASPYKVVNSLSGSEDGVWGSATAFTAGSDPLTVLEGDVFSDSSVGVSFWLKASAGLDSAVVFSALTEGGAGFEILQDSAEGEAFLCTRFHSGEDTLAIDTLVYGSAEILDGEWHHYSLLIFKKHVAIMVDGELIRNTDFKASEAFYAPELATLGGSSFEGVLDELLVYSAGEGIRDEGDSTWQQLTSFMQTLYALQSPGFAWSSSAE